MADMADLPAGFSGKRYNSRKKVAQAHGIPAAAFGKPQASARSRDASAKLGADCTHTSGLPSSLMCSVTWRMVRC